MRHGARSVAMRIEDAHADPALVARSPGIAVPGSGETEVPRVERDQSAGPRARCSTWNIGQSHLWAMRRSGLVVGKGSPVLRRGERGRGSKGCSTRPSRCTRVLQSGGGRRRCCRRGWRLLPPRRSTPAANHRSPAATSRSPGRMVPRGTSAVIGCGSLSDRVISVMGLAPGLGTTPRVNPRSSGPSARDAMALQAANGRSSRAKLHRQSNPIGAGLCHSLVPSESRSRHPRNR